MPKFEKVQRAYPQRAQGKSEVMDFRVCVQASGVAPANQTKERAKTKRS